MRTSESARPFRSVCELGADDARLVVWGEIDFADVPSLAGSLIAFERIAGSRRMTIDLSRVTFMDVAGWRTVARVRRRCTVRMPGGPARRVFDMLEGSRLAVADTRIQKRVGDVDDQVHDDDEERAEQHRALNAWKVEPLDRVVAVATDTRDVEHGLDEDHPAE